MKYRLQRAGKVYEIDVEVTPQGYLLRGLDGEARLLQLSLRADGSQHAITPWGDIEIVSARRGGELWAKLGARRVFAEVERVRPAAGAGGGSSAGSVLAPMTGKLLRVEVQVGQVVKAGQALAVIEAMKMENELTAPLDGVVTEIAATLTGTVEKGTLIVRLEPQ